MTGLRAVRKNLEGAASHIGGKSTTVDVAFGIETGEEQGIYR